MAVSDPVVANYHDGSCTVLGTWDELENVIRAGGTVTLPGCYTVVGVSRRPDGSRLFLVRDPGGVDSWMHLDSSGLL